MSNINYDQENELSAYEVMAGVPETKALLLVDALLFAVYGWTPDKVKRMKLSSIRRWVELAKKRMSWGDAFKLRRLLESKKKPLWRKLLLKIKR